jgi:ribose-phosphate pyrophosphokinase
VTDAVLCIGPGGLHLGEPVRALLDAPAFVAESRTFPDGEVCVRLPERVYGCTVVILQGTHPPQERRLQELYQLVDAAAGAGARRVLCVVPYFAYSRQDRRSRPGEPSSFSIVCRTLAMLGAEAVATVELHNPAAVDAALLAFDSLPTAEVASAYLRDVALSRPVLVSPDRGGRRRAEGVARLIGAPVVVLTKRKDPDGRTWFEPPDEMLAGCDAVVIDDVCSSGSTLMPLSTQLVLMGANALHFVVTHFFADHDELLNRSALPLRIAATDTVPTPAARLSVAPLLADWIVRRLESGSRA